MNFEHFYFKAPCKLVFSHPETEGHYKGDVEINIPPEFVRRVLEVLWSPMPDDPPGSMRAVFISAFIMPKMRDEEGNLIEPNWSIVLREKPNPIQPYEPGASGNPDTEGGKRVDDGDHDRQQAQ
jgi:hypothetical protein